MTCYRCNQPITDPEYLDGASGPRHLNACPPAEVLDVVAELRTALAECVQELERAGLGGAGYTDNAKLAMARASALLDHAEGA